MLSDPAFDLSDADEDCVVLTGSELDRYLETRPRRPTPGPSKEYLEDSVKYTAKDRALAIRICQIAAMTPSLHGMFVSAAEALGIDAPSGRHEHPAESLAFAAWSAVEEQLNDGTYTDAMLDAEAECLLRDGWSPGEPVIRLGGAP